MKKKREKRFHLSLSGNSMSAGVEMGIVEVRARQLFCEMSKHSILKTAAENNSFRSSPNGFTRNDAATIKKVASRRKKFSLEKNSTVARLRKTFPRLIRAFHSSLLCSDYRLFD